MTHYRDNLVKFNSALRNDLFDQGFSGDVFENDVEVGIFEEVLMDLDDVGMVELAKSFYLSHGCHALLPGEGDNLANTFDFAVTLHCFADDAGCGTGNDLFKMIAFVYVSSVY